MFFHSRKKFFNYIIYLILISLFIKNMLFTNRAIIHIFKPSHYALLMIYMLAFKKNRDLTS